MLSARSCCLSVICRLLNVSPLSSPKPRTCSGLMERPQRVWSWARCSWNNAWYCVKDMYWMLSVSMWTDPFVKVYLLQDGRKISKKKTSVKRDDTNPIFNEAMIFSVPAIVLQVTTHIYLSIYILSVCLSIELSTGYIVLSFFFRISLWEWLSLRAQRTAVVKTWVMWSSGQRPVGWE